MGGETDVPSLNRWGTCSKHLAKQTLGHMTSNILARSLQRTFPAWNTPDRIQADAGDNEDFDAAFDLEEMD